VGTTGLPGIPQIVLNKLNQEHVQRAPLDALNNSTQQQSQHSNLISNRKQYKQRQQQRAAELQQPYTVLRLQPV
jgi:hypothetical protein